MRARTGSATRRAWDYVIVGAGASGCVVAGRLSQTVPDACIALIEAGGNRLGLTTRIPGAGFIASTSPRRNWNFETEPIQALNGRRLWWFQGANLPNPDQVAFIGNLKGWGLIPQRAIGRTASLRPSCQ